WTGGTSEQNKKLFLEIVDSGILTALRDNEIDKALEILREILPDQFTLQTAME
ncbi:MAG: hypothetical protein FJY85_23325, partial [Deltaproteobacteria bacterium]|nr:hypothetical protein [Deltaproteobacteria bacterium]